MQKFIAQRVNAVPPSGIRKFFDIAATMKEVISLGIGEPDFVSPKAVIEAGIESLRAGETAYTSNSGLFELREGIAHYIQRLYGIEYHPDTEILITVGVSEALYLALNAILNHGDEVIVPEPCFVSYAPEVVFAGGVPVMIRTTMEDSFEVDAAAIEAAITPKTKAILLGYPNNPTGGVMPKEKLLEIATVVEKHDLLVISDEIYERLIYSGFQHTHFATLPNMKDRTIVMSGMSKAHAMTGWRVGYVTAHPELLAAMRKIHQYTVMSAPTVGQFAALKALECEEDVHHMVGEYDRRRQLIVQGFNELGLACFEPKGAFYAFPNISASGMDEETFCEKLLNEEHVAVIPGTAFGTSGKNHVRACYAAAYEDIERALERIRHFMQRYG
jgi:aminotransferase